MDDSLSCRVGCHANMSAAHVECRHTAPALKLAVDATTIARGANSGRVAAGAVRTAQTACEHLMEVPVGARHVVTAHFENREAIVIANMPCNELRRIRVNAADNFV